MNGNSNSSNGPLGDSFDRSIRAIHDLPDVIKTAPSTRRVVHPVLGVSQTFIVQTYRQRERGDTIFIEYSGAEGNFRVALPPEVALTIARQRDALTDKSRSRAARSQAEERKALGIEPFKKKEK